MDFVNARRCGMECTTTLLSADAQSQAEEKGADCVTFFKDLQQCMATHPEAFQEFFAKEGEGQVEGDSHKGAKKANA